MFDGRGFKAEELAARQFKGRLAEDLEDQYKDIDLFIDGTDGKTYSISIKDQKWSSSQYGGIQIETTLVSTEKRKTMKGCFYANKSDYYMWLITYDSEHYWFVVKSYELKKWVKKHEMELKTWRTRPITEEKNRKLGRTYDRSTGYTIKLDDDFLSIGKLLEVEVYD